MGYGINVGCKCRRKELTLGCGFSFPAVYQETMKDIKTGKYGPEMKDLANNTEFVAVDAETEPYFCEKCGNIEALQPLDLYKPKDVKKVKEQVIGRWTAVDSYDGRKIEELGELPYWFHREGEDEDDNWMLLKEYKHVCPGCGGVMRKINEDELEGKTCPKCGEQYKVFQGILWD